MTKLTDKKQINVIVLIFMLTYFTSYITRTNFGAIISEISSSTQISKSTLSIALTLSFISYGIGQIVSGFFGDRFSAKRLVQYGFITTIIMNVFIPFCSNPYYIMAVWFINGFAQAFMWPPLIKLMTTLFSKEDYRNASLKVSWGGSFGTVAVYIFSPILIYFFNWKAVFFFSAICGLIALLVWTKYCPNIETEPIQTKLSKNSKEKGKFFDSLIFCIMIAIVLQGMLRDGVTTWMPSLIAETYHFSNSISILTGVALPIFSIFCFQITAYLYRIKFQNPILCAGVVFATGSIFALLLILFFNKSVSLFILCTALLTGCMHGVNLMLISMVPAYFEKYGNVSMVSGMLNFCTYVGSAISTYGIAKLTELFDWSFTLKTWLVIAILGTILTFSSVRPWTKRMQQP